MSPDGPAAARRWRLVRGSGGPPSRFVARSRRRRLRALLPYLVVLAVLAVTGGLGWVVYGTTMFVADEVRVEGARTIGAAEVRKVAAVPVDVPLAQVDTAAIAARVRALPAVEEVRVTRSWPGTVTVVVTERTGVAVLARGRQFVLVDAGGVPFRTVAARPSALPLVEVAKPSPGDRATRAALSVATALTEPLRKKLVRIAAPTPEQVTLHLADGRTVFWGDAEDNARKATVTTALLDKPGKKLDVSAPDVVTVR
jgi:cell division protein FtsQ